MNLIKYNPSLRNTENKSFSTLLDQFFNDSFGQISTNGFNPQVDIAETDRSFEIELAVPGMKKEDFSIDMKKDQLIISGERKRKNEAKELNYHSIETAYGSFKKSFYLPDTIKVDKIEASYVDGILTITLPKDEKKEEIRTIQVK